MRRHQGRLNKPETCFLIEKVSYAEGHGEAGGVEFAIPHPQNGYVRVRGKDPLQLTGEGQLLQDEIVNPARQVHPRHGVHVRLRTVVVLKIINQNVNTGSRIRYQSFYRQIDEAVLDR